MPCPSMYVACTPHYLGNGIGVWSRIGRHGPSSFPSHLPSQAYTEGESGEWTGAASFDVVNEGLVAFTHAVKKLEARRSLVDVDEHLDDASKDFRNPQIAEFMSAALS